MKQINVIVPKQNVLTVHLVTKHTEQTYILIILHMTPITVKYLKTR